MEAEINSIIDEFAPKLYNAYFKLFEGYDEDVIALKIQKKNSEQCRHFLLLGNLAYVDDYHDEEHHRRIWSMYIDSLKFAEPNSEELAMTYAVLSNFFLHMRKYKESMQVLEKALSITKLNDLKVELYCYKAKCSVALCQNVERNALQKAKFYLNRVKVEKVKDALIKKVEEVERIVEENEDDIQVNDEESTFDNISNSIDIRYTKKYGKHLVATQDLNMGDVVCVEKRYASVFHIKATEAYCGHCSNSTLNVIPCDHCIYQVYCSEKCKNEAWEKYHDLECSIFPYLYFYEILRHDNIFLSLRLVLMAIKEYGNISKLREELQIIDKCKNKNTGFMINGEICNKNFTSIYMLSSSCKQSQLDHYKFCSLHLIYILLKHSEIFGNFIYDNTKDLRNNKDIIFIAALILKCLKITNINADFIYEVNSPLFVEENNVFNKISKSKGKFIAPLSSLINHSCNPNVCRVFLNNNKVVYFCIQPIKKNSQIFVSYRDYAFYNFQKHNRRKFLMENYQFRCNCEACENNWQAFSVDFTNAMLGFDKIKLAFDKYSATKEFCDIFDMMEDGETEYFTCYINKIKNKIERETVIHNLAQEIGMQMKKLSFPNSSSIFLLKAFITILIKFYNSAELEMSDYCKQNLRLIDF